MKSLMELQRTPEQPLSEAGTNAGRPAVLDPSRTLLLPATPEEASRQTRRIHTILVATDFSRDASRAVEFAARLANLNAAKLTLLHVIDINLQPAPGAEGTAENLMSRAWARAVAELAQAAGSLAARVRTETLLIEGLPWEQIVEQSRAYDLLIMGRPARKSPWRIFSQHTARRVIQNAECPVLVAGPPIPLEALREQADGQAGEQSEQVRGTGSRAPGSADGLHRRAVPASRDG